ncbi:Angiopoietin-related protein 6 [Amphibalanus amphitrite]|uniref:Angiopoietin-related protein 6 n=1 Tax=Amphibalanus amphitrite TaxID=1232801 RepID=A0A6A4VJL2_AMPAM|nr:Angiopoietin-related protein 6 [Amphibalanus amphitrite]
MQKISSDLDQVKHEFKPYDLKVRVLSDNVISLSQQLQVTSDILEKHLAEEAGAPPPSRRPGTVRDCSDLPAGARSGVHLLQTGLAGPQKVAALCDLDADGGRWTVIQRRDDIEPRENFYRNWTAYRAGFGRLDGEFWWGLDKMSALTAATDRSYELRVNLEDFEGRRRHALYGQFSIAPESDGFRLHVSNYSGDAGDSLSTHSGQRFTTYDRDHDPYAGNCARSHRGGWWYHEKCLQSNLNGVYFKKYRADNTRGITWTTFHNSFYSLKTVTMKIRPT